MIDKLQFISHNTNGLTHLESIQKALDAGCCWIQLRVKGATPESVLEKAFVVKQLCENYNAKLIINDYPQIARTVSAHGLHLGLNDMAISGAREIVGNEMIIGGTANTWTDVQNRIADGADYIGLGPYRFTKTKQNLSPVVSLEEYGSIMKRLKDIGQNIPVIAIGGITSEDIPALVDAGIYGVAISGSIINAKNPKILVSQIVERLC